jgi:hypothetical protein
MMRKLSIHKSTKPRINLVTTRNRKATTWLPPESTRFEYDMLCNWTQHPQWQNYCWVLLQDYGLHRRTFTNFIKHPIFSYSKAYDYPHITRNKKIGKQQQVCQHLVNH